MGNFWNAPVGNTTVNNNNNKYAANNLKENSLVKPSEIQWEKNKSNWAMAVATQGFNTLG